MVNYIYSGNVIFVLFVLPDILQVWILRHKDYPLLPWLQISRMFQRCSWILFRLFPWDHVTGNDIKIFEVLPWLPSQYSPKEIKCLVIFWLRVSQRNIEQKYPLTHQGYAAHYPSTWINPTLVPVLFPDSHQLCDGVVGRRRKVVRISIPTCMSVGYRTNVEHL